MILLEFTLLQNGADSFKKAKTSIQHYEQVVEEYSSHHLKDAILSLSHSIEILFKYILSEKSEYLIFSDLKKLTEATKQLTEYQKKPNKIPIKGGFGFRKKYYKSVFDVPKGRKLQTIGIGEAKERVKYLCDISIPDELEQGIITMQSYRNQITHNTINIDSFEKTELISNLKILHENTHKFFESNILDFNQTYGEQRFEISIEEYENHRIGMEEYYREMAEEHEQFRMEAAMEMAMAEEQEQYEMEKGEDYYHEMETIFEEME